MIVELQAVRPVDEAANRKRRDFVGLFDGPLLIIKNTLHRGFNLIITPGKDDRETVSKISAGSVILRLVSLHQR